MPTRRRSRHSRHARYPARRGRYFEAKTTRAHRSDERHARGDLVHHAQARGDADVQTQKARRDEALGDGRARGEKRRDGRCVISRTRRAPTRPSRRDERRADASDRSSIRRRFSRRARGRSPRHPVAHGTALRHRASFTAPEADTPIFVAPSGGFLPVQRLPPIPNARDVPLRDRATPRRRVGTDPDAAPPRPDAGTREKTRGGAVAAHPRAAAPAHIGCVPRCRKRETPSSFRVRTPPRTTASRRASRPPRRLTVPPPRVSRSKQPIFPSATRNTSRPRRPWT